MFVTKEYDFDFGSAFDGEFRPFDFYDQLPMYSSERIWGWNAVVFRAGESFLLCGVELPVVFLSGYTCA